MNGTFDFLKEDNNNLNSKVQNLQNPQKKEFHPVPEGDYHLEVVEAMEKVSKTGNTYINVHFKIIEGDHQNRRIFDIFNVNHPTEKVKKNAQKKFEKFLYQSGIDKKEFKGCEDLAGARVSARVEVHDNLEYGPQNKIRYYFDQTDSVVEDLF